MPLLYDARLIDNSGIGTTIQGQLAELIRRNLPLTLTGDPARITESFPSFQGTIVPFTARLYSLREQFSYPGAGAGLIHFPHYNAAIRFLTRATVTVHDLIHLQSDQFRNPAYRGYALTLLSLIAKYARCILTVSEATRSQFLHLFPGARSRTFAAPNGLDPAHFFPASPSAVSQFRVRHSLPEKYFLAIGIAKRHKNLDTLLRALALLWREERAMPLVIAGTGGKIPEYAARELRENIARKNVILLPRIPQLEMAAMYSSAQALVMPSRFEGFGLPALEALACGTHVICSDIPSLREVCADAVTYFDPHSPEDIAAALEAKPPRTRQTRLKRAALFTWKRNVDLMLRAYEACGLSI